MNTRSSRRRFLFVLWDGGGTIPPQLAIARRLAARGHDIRVLAPRTFQARIEAAECVFVPYQRAPEYNVRARPLAKNGESDHSGGAAVPPRNHLTLLFEAVLPYAEDVLAELGSTSADALVTDYLLFGASLAAETAGLPCAALIPTIYPLPAPGLPPFSSGFQPARGPLGHLRDALQTRFIMCSWSRLCPISGCCLRLPSLVCVPMGRDQQDVAARVVWHGAGVPVSSKAPPEALREAITRVLADQRYRDAAKRIGAAMAQENGSARASAKIETLVGKNAPAL